MILEVGKCMHTNHNHRIKEELSEMLEIQVTLAANATVIQVVIVVGES